MNEDPRKAGAARRAEQAEHEARRSRLIGRYGEPERIDAADALALANAARVPVDPTAAVVDLWASIYRCDVAADAWLESNRVHNGVPTLAKVPLGDGRVIGILDLRPALARSREES